MPTITAHQITVDDVAYACDWSLTPTGTVFAFVDAADGKRVRITFAPDAPHYADALAACQQAKAEHDAMRAVLRDAERANAEYLAAQRADDAPLEAPAAQRAEKKPLDFVGQTIKGKGWRIEFDGGYGKTRVIFTRRPSEGVKALVKGAGFYWSPTLKSWNKGLNWRAYRAALDLAARLRYYPNEPIFAQHIA